MGNKYSIYENLPEGVIKYKKDGKISYCNKRALELFKYEPDTYPNTIFDLMDEEHIESHKNIIKSKANHSMSNKNIIGICRDKSKINIDIIILPFKILIISNIKADKIKNLAMYKTILTQTEELCSTGYWKWEITSGNLEWSPGLKKIFEVDEVSYEKYISCIHPEDRELINQTIEKCLFDRKDYRILHRLVCFKTKKVKWLNNIGKYVYNEKGSFLTGVAQDVTLQCATEVDLKIKTEKAEENLRVKSDFVSSVSHELRTPLNGIIGMVSLLQCTPLSDKQEKYVSVLRNSCGVLLSIINNILDFSKIESGKMTVDFSPCNIKESVKKILDLFRPLAVTKDIKFETYFDLKSEVVITDQVKLSQILTNLLSNSLKFTQYGVISVDVTSTIDAIKMSVRDTGIGIHEDFLKNITSPFTQADTSTTRNYGGSGLGLSIVSSYVDILNGTLDIKSKHGEGTTIIITLPVKSENIEDVILVVEDNKANQFLIKEFISELTNIPVKCYDNGTIIMREINSEPLLIFMDLHMPLMDGHTTTKELRKQGYICPIIALTANSLKNEKIKCLESGMDDFLLKPVDLSDIRLMLQKFKVI